MSMKKPAGPLQKKFLSSFDGQKTVTFTPRSTKGNATEVVPQPLFTLQTGFGKPVFQLYDQDELIAEIYQTEDKKQLKDQLMVVNYGYRPKNHCDVDLIPTDVCLRGQEQQFIIQQRIKMEDSNIFIYPPFKKLTKAQQASLNHSQPFENQSTPLFMRKFNSINAFYPNLFHPLLDKLKQWQKMNQIWDAAYESVQLLYGVGIKIKCQSKYLKVFSEHDICQLTVAQFISRQWESSNFKVQREKLKFLQTYQPQQDCQMDIMTLLLKLDVILKLLYADAGRIKKLKSITEDFEWKNAYIRVRKTLWQIQQQIRQIGAIFYLKMLENQYPDFYYDYVDILKGKPIRDPIALKSQIKYLTSINEPLTVSKIGEEVKRILQKQ